MTNFYENNSSQSERREVVANDRKNEAKTMLERAQREVGDELGGRFKALAPKVSAVPIYPKQPESSPWSQGHLTGTEPPLGYEIHKVRE